MKTYEYQKSFIDANLLYRVLENARRQSSDIVLIPRFLNKNLNNGFETSGIQARTLTVLSDYSDFVDLQQTPLWLDETLSYIALYSKDIPPYLKIINDNNLKDLYIIMHKYIVNGMPVSVARTIKGTKQIEIINPMTNKAEKTYPILSLIPYQNILNAIRLMQYKVSSSNIINTIQIDMKDDVDFIDTWNSMSSEGSRVWVPNEEKYGSLLKPYILYLAKCMFSFSKADKVSLEIRDNIIDERLDVFIAKFTVNRKKGKHISNHQYFVSGYKL